MQQPASRPPPYKESGQILTQSKILQDVCIVSMAEGLRAADLNAEFKADREIKTEERRMEGRREKRKEEKKTGEERLVCGM